MKKILISLLSLGLLTNCGPDRPHETDSLLTTSSQSSSVTDTLDDSSVGSHPTEIGTSNLDSSSSSDSIFSTATEIENICGNEILEFPEECDQGILGTRWCTNNCTISFCGDNLINSFAGEDCDDGNFNDFDSCSLNCQSSRLVFLTTDAINPDFGGIEKADDFCQNDANKFGLSGKYKAWLSDENIANSPKIRFNSLNFKGWYKMPSKTDFIVAKGWEGLKEPLINPINVIPSGFHDLITDSVWSNTKSNGDSLNEFGSCLNWTSLLNTVIGEIGSPQSIFLWSEAEFKFCSSRSSSKLYCFQVE